MNLFEYIYPRFYFSKDKPIRLFEAFSGIGCQAMALKRITSNFELVGFSEIDKPAIQSYKAIHGEVRNYGDITKMEKIPPCDIFTWSFPCTDLSKAGKQKGLDGTRSGLVYEVLRLLRDTAEFVPFHRHIPKHSKIISVGYTEYYQPIPNISKLPKVLIMENVIDLVQVKFVKAFNEIQLELEQLGYKNYNEVLNAKDYGIPQNRERIFMVSILGDYSYDFPEPKKLELRLKDMFEDEVDEKYYLSEKTIARISSWNAHQKPLENIEKEKIISPTLTARGAGEEHSGMVLISEPKCLNSKVNGKQPSLQDRVYDSDAISTAITTSFMPSIIQKSRGYNKGGEHDICPPLTSNSFHENNFVKQNIKNIMTEVASTLGTNCGSSTSSGGGVVVAAEIRTDEGIRTFDDNNMGALRTTGSCGDKVVIELISKNKRLKSVVENNDFSKDDTKNIDIFNQKVSDISQTLTLPNHNSQAIYNNLRIRKLTPLECWRLMGISDDDFNKARLSGMSNSQLYKQAGNGIVVNVFEAILRELIK